MHQTHQPPPQAFLGVPLLPGLTPPVLLYLLDLESSPFLDCCALKPEGPEGLGAGGRQLLSCRTWLSPNHWLAQVESEEVQTFTTGDFVEGQLCTNITGICCQHGGSVAMEKAVVSSEHFW